MVAKMAARRSEAGTRYVLEGLGLKPDQVDQLESHASKIDVAVMHAEANRTQLLLAKEDYDKRLRSMLSEENYTKYRAFEDQGRAREEARRLRAYLRDSGTPLDDEWVTRLIPKIAESSAYTGIYWPGPLDPVEEARVGFDAVQQHGLQQLESIRQGWRSLEASVDDETRASEAWRTVARYYQNQIEERERRNQRIVRSEELRQQLGPGGFMDAIRTGKISP